MGYLTPILIRNDALLQIEENPDELLEAIKEACNDTKENDYGVGYHVNCIEGLGTAHADLDRVVVISGNTMRDVARYSEKDNARVDIIKDDIKILQKTIKLLQHKLKQKK